MPLHARPKNRLMKKVGIVGGIGWQSTVDYYTDLCHRAEQQCLAANSHRAPSTPEMSIESLDMQKAISYLGSDDDEASWVQFDDYHRVALLRLAASGADFALLASNTPHHRFATIVRGVGIPVIDLYAVIAEHCARIAAGEVLILGTAFTMKSQRLRNAFARVGVQAAAPQGAAAQEVMHLIADLNLNRLASAAGRIAQIARISFARSTASQTVCLACTELLLAFPEHRRTVAFEVDGIRYTNASALHMDAAFEFAVQ
jgi:aspartate racemase